MAPLLSCYTMFFLHGDSFYHVLSIAHVGSCLEIALGCGERQFCDDTAPKGAITHDRIA